MTQNIPPELQNEINRQVLNFLNDKSAHSDVVDSLITGAKSLGDVQIYCPDPAQYRYFVVSTRGVVIAIAFGMDTVAFRLDERMKARALESGGALLSECGNEWVSFTLFQDDLPIVDAELWARKAYVAARDALN